MAGGGTGWSYFSGSQWRNEECGAADVGEMGGGCVPGRRNSTCLESFLHQSLHMCTGMGAEILISALFVKMEICKEP